MFTTYSLCAFLGMILLIFVAANPALVSGWNGLKIPNRIDRRGAWAQDRTRLFSVLLLSLGLGLRLWQLLRTPVALLPEEAWTALEAQSLLEGGKSMAGKSWPALYAGWGGEAEGPLLVWFSLLPVRLLGPSALAVRIPLFLVSSLAMVALWDSVRRAASPKAALWVLLLCVISPWHLLQSRWALAFELLPHLLVLALWMCMRERRRGIWLCGAFLLLALGMYTGDTAWYVLPLLVLGVALIQWRRRAVRWWQSLLALSLFVALSVPALQAFAVQALQLPARTAWGMDIPVIEEYAHAEDGIWQTPIDHSEDLETAAALEYLSFAQGNEHIKTFYEHIIETGSRVFGQTLMQSASEPVYTKAFLLPKYGFAYLFSVPLGLLGVFLCLIRPLWQRGKQKVPSPRRKHLEHLWLAVTGAAVPFFLLHLDLSTAHYTLWYYPVLLLTAYGIVFLTRRLRLSGVLLLVLYGFAVGGFLAEPQDVSHSFPGFDEAVAEAAQYEDRQIVVSTHLYPHPGPVRAAEGKVILGFGLSPAEVRGEDGAQGALSYQERFRYVYMPAHDMDLTPEAITIVHESEAYTLPAEGYDFHYHGQYVVLIPQAK